MFTFESGCAVAWYLLWYPLLSFSSRITENNMADEGKKKKVARETSHDGLVIRAKGQLLRLPLEITEGQDVASGSTGEEIRKRLYKYSRIIIIFQICNTNNFTVYCLQVVKYNTFY